MSSEIPRSPQAQSQAVSRAMRANARPTKPEVDLRSALHRRGLRFRKSARIDLRGRWTRPDIVFVGPGVAVFLDGCFWHRCPEHGTLPRANAEYWLEKLERNVARDRDTDERLEALGWSVVRGWEHEPREQLVERVVEALAVATSRGSR